MTDPILPYWLISTDQTTPTIISIVTLSEELKKPIVTKFSEFLKKLNLDPLYVSLDSLVSINGLNQETNLLNLSVKDRFRLITQMRYDAFMTIMPHLQTKRPTILITDDVLPKEGTTPVGKFYSVLIPVLTDFTDRWCSLDEQQKDKHADFLFSLGNTFPQYKENDGFKYLITKDTKFTEYLPENGRGLSKTFITEIKWSKLSEEERDNATSVLALETLLRLIRAGILDENIDTRETLAFLIGNAIIDQSK